MAAARAQARSAARSAVGLASGEAARARLQSSRLAAERVRRGNSETRIAMAVTSSLSRVQAKTQPSALQDFGSAVVDKVGAQNPLLAEDKIVPREPERDALLPPPTEMSQSFDSVPSIKSASTKKKVRQSKNVSLQEETMEAVNFLNLINLRLLP